MPTTILQCFHRDQETWFDRVLQRADWLDQFESCDCKPIDFENIDFAASMDRSETVSLHDDDDDDEIIARRDPDPDKDAERVSIRCQESKSRFVATHDHSRDQQEGIDDFVALTSGPTRESSRLPQELSMQSLETSGSRQIQMNKHGSDSYKHCHQERVQNKGVSTRSSAGTDTHRSRRRLPRLLYVEEVSYEPTKAVE